MRGVSGVELDEFVGNGLDRLLRFAHALTGERASAEDVVQEVVIRLFISSNRPRDVVNLDSYARRMVVNEYLSWGRKWFRVRPSADLDKQRGAADHTALIGDRDELRRQLARLPRRQRAVLVMRFYGAMTDTEIAADLGCSVATVRSHASRALASLRVQMASDEAQEQETGQ
jgi:RNA polymerase sigma-70 factor (sigma-E family)